MSALSATEHGDRHAFLARVTTRAARSYEPNVAHPLPASAFSEGEFVPIGYRSLDSGDLVGSFLRNAAVALLDAHRVPVVDDGFLRAHIDAHEIRTAVVSSAPAAVAIGLQLAALGVAVEPYSRDPAAVADLGVTAPRFGIAATGSLVQDSSLDGGRGASLVPRLHLAVLPVSAIVGTTADVFATFPVRPDGMPANIVLITGPSRTGDIEMILTVGVHGPTKVIVALTD